jgi:HSP20 family protein
MRKQNLVRIVLAGVLVTGLLMFSSQGWADDTARLKEQVKALQDRVDQLESQLAGKQQVTTPTVIPFNDQWNDPFAQMARMREQMEHNMHQAFAETGAFNPRMDMRQTDKAYLVTMDIPGVDKDKINVEVKQGTLIISGERDSETKDNKNNQYYRQERSFGSFLQVVPLPEDAKTDQIEAKYKNGVLTVTVARSNKEEKKLEGQKIKVK